MGTGKSKEQLREAAEGGQISSAVLEEHWVRFTQGDESMSKIRAIAFLKSIAQEVALLDVSERELERIVEACLTKGTVQSCRCDRSDSPPS